MIDWTQVQQLVFSAVGIVLTGLATWITTRIVAWLNSKIKDKKVANNLTTLTTIIMDAVQEVMQTYVDALKKEGAFTEKAQKEALAKCKDIVLSKLTPELTEYIESTFGDVQDFIVGKIEATIYNLKNK